VYSSNDESSYVLRLVVLVTGQETSTRVTVRAQAQHCPPHTTVFDRCTATPGKVIPESVQEKIDAVAHRIAEG
jgi:hypothetical protein